MIGGDDDKPKDKDPVVVADTGKDGSEGTKPSGDPGTTKQPEPSGPKLGEVDPPKQPEPETPKQPEPEIPKQPEPETPKQPEPETPKQPEPQTPKPKNPPPHKDEVKKSLTDEDISKGIGKAVGAVSACKGPLPIKISVRYKITADGRAKVSSVEKSGGGLLSDETKECVKRAVENKAKFPKHEDLKLSSFTF
ncbi:MAG: hypothetical protein IPN32_25885 [Deltaproteobacteria bacterium]|nr:hypothetical protein [Deltaproteobacteria bacterium]